MQNHRTGHAADYFKVQSMILMRWFPFPTCSHYLLPCNSCETSIFYGISSTTFKATQWWLFFLFNYL